MASPNSTFTELVTTTLRNHRAVIADNVSNNNALYQRLTKKGKIRMEDGGYTIVADLEYAENSTFQRYSGYDTLNISPSDVLTAAEYNWKQAAVHVSASGRELRINSGKNAMVNLVRKRVKNALKTFGNNLSTDFYSLGTEPNQVNGLQALIANAGAGTVGGINSSTFTFWKNAVQSAAAPLQGGSSITPSKSTIKSLMNPLWMELTRGSDKPDLIVSDNVYFGYYWEALQDLQRYANDDKAAAGFQSLKYVTADVVFDSGTLGGGAVASTMYFINTDYLEVVVHRDANIDVLDDEGGKKSTNQDAVIIPVIWMGNLVCSNRSLQGVLKA